MLKASQNRMKRADLSEASMSRLPALTIGWLAITPMLAPPRRMNPMMMFLAKSSWISKKSLWSATWRMIRFMS